MTCCAPCTCCTLQGVPHELRGWVWWHVSGAGEAAAAGPDHYQHCLQAGSSKAAVKQVGATDWCCEKQCRLLIVIKRWASK